MNKKQTLLLFLLISVSMYAQQPKELVQEMITMFEKSSVQAQYTISIQEQGSDIPYIHRGKFLMNGNKFRLLSDGLEVYFDGKTQQVYMEEAQEISISEPQEEELLQINPILMAKAMLKSCELHFSSAGKEPNTHVIDFLPKKPNEEIQKLTIHLRTTDKMLMRITILSVQGLTTQLQLSGQKLNVPTNDSDFVLNANQYLDAIRNDLR